MDELKVALYILGALAAIAGATWVVVQLVTAGKGSFLKERNEELAGAYEQVQAQRDNERADAQRQITELRDLVNQLKGEVAAHRVEYARVIAKEVVSALRRDGWLKGSDS